MHPSPERWTAESSALIQVDAVHHQGLVGRLAVLLNAHAVDEFHYDVSSDGSARLLVRVTGGTWQQDRVAARLRRVVGVVGVRVE